MATSISGSLVNLRCAYFPDVALTIKLGRPLLETLTKWQM